MKQAERLTDLFHAQEVERREQSLRLKPVFRHEAMTIAEKAGSFIRKHGWNTGLGIAVAPFLLEHR